MDYIDRNILELYDIYHIHLASTKDKEIASHILTLIPKALGEEIFKIYLYGDRAYGYKNSNKHEFAVILDVPRNRIDDMISDHKEELEKALSSDKETVYLAFISACDFEKCKERTTDFDYYVDTYGILLYDSHQKPKIKEGTRHYASAALQNYQRLNYFDGEQRPILLPYLLQVYIAKKGYLFPIMPSSQDVVFKMLPYMAVEPEVKEAISFIQETEDTTLKVQKFNALESYILDMKYTTTLKVTEDIDTMHVYEKLMIQKRKEGSLLLSDLTKDQLYTMYVLQELIPNVIADLYDVPVSKIHYRKNKWGILMKQSTVNDRTILDAYDEINLELDPIETINLQDNPVFAPQALMLDILTMMKDDKEYLIKAFWKFSDKNMNDDERSLFGFGQIPYPRVNIALGFMKKSRLVIETGYYKYMITKRGHEILAFATQNQLPEISLALVEKYFHDFHHILKVRDTHFTEPISYEIEKLRQIKPQSIVTPTIATTEETVLQSPNIDWKDLKEISFVDIPTKGKQSTKKVTNTGRKVNYHKVNSQKLINGEKIEEIVFLYEKNRLMQENQPDLANQVKWVSKEQGDGLGYDIYSFKQIEGCYTPVFIEVKGTTKGPEEPFDISEKEVFFSKQYAEFYYLYRVGIRASGPVFYQLNGSIEEHFALTPTSYRASLL